MSNRSKISAGPAGGRTIGSSAREGGSQGGRLGVVAGGCWPKADGRKQQISNAQRLSATTKLEQEATDETRMKHRCFRNPCFTREYLRLTLPGRREQKRDLAIALIRPITLSPRFAPGVPIRGWRPLVTGRFSAAPDRQSRPSAAWPLCGG